MLLNVESVLRVEKTHQSCAEDFRNLRKNIEVDSASDVKPTHSHPKADYRRVFNLTGMVSTINGIPCSHARIRRSPTHLKLRWYLRSDVGVRRCDLTSRRLVTAVAAQSGVGGSE
jgi:hypothetical protein